jgi:hypothetical protein
MGSEDLVGAPVVAEERTLAEIAARHPPGPPGGPSGGGAPPSGPPAMWPGIVVGAALGVVVGAASLFIPESSPPAPSSGVAAASSPARLVVPVSASAAPKAPAPSASNAMSAASAAGRPAASSAAPSAEPAATPLLIEGESEVDFLRRAHLAPPAEALAMAEAHPRRYPDGRLGQEREMIAIASLGAMGRKDEARARGRLFLTLFPDSTHRRRLEVLVPDLAVTSNPQAP